MFLYLLISLFFSIIHFGMIFIVYKKDRDSFFQTDTYLMILIGGILFILSIAMYFTKQYGFFAICLALQIFYLIANFVLLKNKNIF